MSVTERLLRVAIVGSGPAGFYAAEGLLKNPKVPVEVDMFERLVAPFGLVRSGVAPDHQKIKRATKVFERTAADSRFRLLGNVNVGADISAAELGELYDQVILTFGSSADRKLGIPGEGLPGSHAATAFVGWYNAHPSFVSESFNLSCERAVVIGMGNVAMDVARVLLRHPEELATTDIADHALEALRKSQINEVVLIGRRGPAEAAFDLGELTDIAALEGVNVAVSGEEVGRALAEADQLSQADRRKLEYMAELSQASPKAGKVLRLEFLSSPVELVGETQVERIRLEKNQLLNEGGKKTARGTGALYQFETGLVFRSIGYQGVAMEGLPFDAGRGVIPNRGGRVLSDLGQHLAPFYVAGWIKRGPTGVIGTNKPDALETVALMLADAEATSHRRDATRSTVDALLARRGVAVTSFADWARVDQLEITRGEAKGKVREKFLSNQSMIDELKR